MTVSLCVVLLEMCNSQATLPFLMVVIIVAKGAADRLGDPLVVRRIKLKGLPFIARMPHLSQRRGRLSAATIVRKSDFPLLPPCALATPAPRCARAVHAAPHRATGSLHLVQTVCVCWTGGRHLVAHHGTSLAVRWDVPTTRSSLVP